jgi:hypothetical protein
VGCTELDCIINAAYADITGEVGEGLGERAASAAAVGVFPVVDELQQLNTGEQSEELTRGVVDAQFAAEVAGVMVGDAERLFTFTGSVVLDQQGFKLVTAVRQKLGYVKYANLLGQRHSKQGIV